MSVEPSSSSERVNALAAVLSPPKDPPIACCPGCQSPLVGTIAFSGAEFYCLDCGRACGFMAPHRGDPGDESLARRLRVYEAEWREHVQGKLLSAGVWHEGCEKCSPRGEPHSAHAGDEERAADAQAREWLHERALAAGRGDARR